MYYWMPIFKVLKFLPNKGIASLVAGIVSARTCENTVRDSRIVTPEKHIIVHLSVLICFPTA